MTWPSGDVDTTGMDSGSDTPPRATFLSWAQKFNLLINHPSAFMRGLMTATDAASARSTLDVPTRTGDNASGSWGVNITGTAENITGTAAIANGGTGQTSAAAAFNALKQAASLTTSGVVEIATDGEADAGTDATRAITPSNLRATSFGRGQTPQVLTGSRTLGVSYTNSTGRPIEVSARVLQASGSASSFVTLIVDGVEKAWSPAISANVAISSSVSGVVPNGSVYSISIVTGSMALEQWAELR